MTSPSLAFGSLRHEKSTSRLRMRLAKGLRRAREAKGWTQEDLADHARINPRTVRDLEAGVTNATLDTLERLTSALRIDIQRLFDR